MKTKHLCKAERSSSNIISTLPQSIIEIILCLLTTKEAARTSILSREWRYKWTKISKLEFYHKTLYLPARSTNTRCKLFNDLHEVLLRHQVPIHELTIRVCPDCDYSEFDRIILHLSKNHTFKKLTIDGWDMYAWFNIPISVSSLPHLTDLYLNYVNFEHQPIFNGFDSLRSLSLQDVGISKKTLLHLLSNCQSLKTLRLIGEISYKVCTIFELFKCLLMIEQLITCWDIFTWLKWRVPDSVPQELPTSLFNLKYVCFEYICFEDGYGLNFLLVLIKCSPNLKKIKLQIEWDHECDGEYSVVWDEYSDVLLEHLNELEIERFLNTKPEMEFVKFILARSPNLKRVRITSYVSNERKLEMLEVLLRAPRASPVRIYV